MSWISFPASIPTEELAWHSVQYKFLCLVLLLVNAVPPAPWHVEQKESLLAGFARVLLCILPLLWHVVHRGVVALEVWL